MEKHYKMAAHSRYISTKTSEVPSNVLFAWLPTCTYEMNLLAIETANNFTNLYPYISALAWKHKCTVVWEGDAKVIAV